MDGRSGGRGAGGGAAIAAAALIVLGAVALVLIAAAAPEGFRSAWGLNRRSADLYRSALGWFPDWRFRSETFFVWSFRTTLLTAWAGWAAMLFAACARPDRLQWAKPAAIAAIVFLAVAAPPIFSTDVFAYAGWSRQMWSQGLNPYLPGEAIAPMASDAGSRTWPSTVPYGPLWTLVAWWLGAAASPGGMFAEILVHKALAAAGLLASAAAAARIAAAIRPGFGAVSWLAIGFCPLLLVEGPISGHNDFVAIGLLTWAAASGLSAPRSWPAVLLGLAVAWKPTALGAVPLLLLLRWRTEGLRAALTSLVLCAAPFLLLSIPFGGIMPILASVAGRVGGGGEMALAPLRIGLLIAGVAWGLWIVLRAAPVSGTTWHEAWIPVSLGIALGTSIVLFPWYFAWTLIPALVRWDIRRFPAVSALCSLALLSMWMYAATLR
jgi:hypothetical protein